jgi:hypothetical protein
MRPRDGLAAWGKKVIVALAFRPRTDNVQKQEREKDKNSDGCDNDSIFFGTVKAQESACGSGHKQSASLSTEDSEDMTP